MKHARSAVPWSLRHLFSIALIALALLAPHAPAAYAGDEEPPPSELIGKRPVQFALSDGNSITGYVYGNHVHQPLVILVHGASDTHAVFDFTTGYRAAKDLAFLGFGVLAIDRVGYGASSRPDGDTLSFAVQAHQLHDVISAVRGGALGFHPPEIITLGVSAGADIAIVEAGTYHDVDGVIIGFHTSQLQPALLQYDVSQWFTQGPYFDFGVQFRTDFFYAEPYASPAIIALDNATRSLVPRAEIVSALNDESAPFVDDIDVPVLLLQAANDELFVPVNDSALFTGSPNVSFELLPHTGHKGFSHYSRELAVLAVTCWLNDTF